MRMPTSKACDLGFTQARADYSVHSQFGCGLQPHFQVYCVKQ
jgi:hypothetical protein